MNLPDSFYIALCMTILLVGAVYWVWTQIQYVQRKVNVLENIVYELKTLCSRPPEGPVASITAGHYPLPPSSVLGEDEDLLHETLRAEIAPYATIEEVDVAPKDIVEEVAAVTEIPEATQITEMVEEIADFQQIPEAAPDFSEPIFDMGKYVVQGEAEQDKGDLQPGGVGSGIVAPSIQSSLEGMTIKELRRLAQQKSISGANEMRKKELIEAIRAVPIESFLE